MQREIKFRAWDKRGKKWIHDFLIDAEGKLWEFDEVRWTGGWNELADGELGQFTGLKDKNGVEIYEGDIVQGSKLEGRMRVEWRGGESELPDLGYFLVTEFGQVGWQMNERFDKYNYEIIGNIYENPGLFK